MVKKELYITIPSLFKCPISLDIMKSPVSLSTGITYDRTNIQRWFDAGNSTCPATMQRIHTKDFIPNITVTRLINIWLTKNRHNFHSVSSGQALQLIQGVLVLVEVDYLTGSSSEELLECFVKILCFASESMENGKVIACNEIFVMRLVEILASEGLDLDPDLLEAILKVFQIAVSTFEYRHKYKLLLLRNNSLSLMQNLAEILNSARSDSRIAVARILEAIATDQESKKAVFNNQDILTRLLDILNDHEGVVVEEINAVLSCLISLTSPRRNKITLIELGGAKILTTLITETSSNENTHATTTENVLTLLEMLVGCTEGRLALTNDLNCIPTIIEKLLKVSNVTNEHAIAILWSLCCLFRDQKAKEAMIGSNGGLTKILLMMQGDCSPAVKRMCCDLLRIFRIFSKSCLSSYDTKNTHIMPC